MTRGAQVSECPKKRLFGKGRKYRNHKQKAFARNSNTKKRKREHLGCDDGGMMKTRTVPLVATVRLDMISRIVDLPAPEGLMT